MADAHVARKAAPWRRNDLTISPQIDFDNPWKEAMQTYLPAFLEFCFPRVYAEIDWTRPYEFLDKEFQQVVRDAALGPRRADLLVRVWLVGGDDAWVLVHVEVQSEDEADFAERLYVYNYRIFDRYRRHVVTLAVLGDERANWCPARYARELWDCSLEFRYPTIKLLDYRAQRPALEESINPFAMVVLAHLDAQGTRGEMAQRGQAKWALTRRLYSKGYTRQQILDVYRFIDWLLELPAAEEALFWQQVVQFEEEQHMPYITSAERLGREIGREIGLQQGLEKGLQQGLERGREEGLERGREEGLERGREEGREEARQQAREDGLRTAIRQFVELRFGAVPAALETRLQETAHEDDLVAFLGRVLSAADVGDLM